MMMPLIIGSILSGAASTLSFLSFGTILDGLNMVEVDTNIVMRALIWYGVINLATSVLCYIERLLLGWFAGNDTKSIAL